ncbi:GGDEF domain-containing protein [Psychrosphaera haliotis]|uniref:diguanylate cyclase n=1 Tax=Psychrosphaera haliotis TaxID=555083 RepID=A0A6N8F5D6_9GAMM|nr:GGDEF domain-containing protein [Psychrosphaera haliotis]MUH71765.1 diguanylate cyclase [Psychrosphaera haliotis]
MSAHLNKDSNSVINMDLLDNSKNRYSIKNKLFLGLSLIFTIFLGLTALTIFRLSEFENVLINIQQVSVPTAIQAGKTYSQVNTLIFLTERLINVQSGAAKRATNEQIQSLIYTLKSDSLQLSQQSYGNTQLKAIIVELQELDELINQRLENKRSFDEKLQLLYTLFNNMPDLDDIESRTSLVDGQLLITNIFANSAQLTFLNRLHLVRQIEHTLQKDLESLLSNYVEGSNTKASKEALVFLSKLQTLLLAPDGLVNTRIKQLRIEGRAIGRGNFMRNLIMDYANQAEYTSFNINNKVLDETKSATKAISTQLTVVVIAFILSLSLFVLIAVYLRNKVVGRLINLNKGVNRRLNGSLDDVIDKGSDEISDIADTFNIFANTVELQKQTLEELSSLDGLTGIANRRAFDDRLSNAIASSQRSKSPLSLLIIDVDYFKPYNDNYGHAKGDDCLKKVARIIDQELPRETDFVARYGGEEFACILPETDEAGAKVTAQKLITAVYSAMIPHSFSEIDDRLTISVGIVVDYFDTNKVITELDLITQADTALYQSKLKGRNRFTVSQGSTLKK